MRKKVIIKYKPNKSIKRLIGLHGIEKTLQILNIEIPEMLKSIGEKINYHKEAYTKEELQSIIDSKY